MQRIQPWCCNKSDSNASICHAVHVSEIGSDTNLAEVRIPPFSLFLGLPPWSGCFSAVWNQIQGSKPYSSSGETAHRNGWCCHFGGWSWQLCNWQCLLGLRLNVSSWGYPSSMDVRARMHSHYWPESFAYIESWTIDVRLLCKSPLSLSPNLQVTFGARR